MERDKATLLDIARAARLVLAFNKGFSHYIGPFPFSQLAR